MEPTTNKQFSSFIRKNGANLGNGEEEEEKVSFMLLFKNSINYNLLPKYLLASATLHNFRLKLLY